MKRRLCRLLAVILLLSVAGALRATEEAEPWTLLRPEVLAEYPHDPAAFTQGLLWHAGLLYESIGLYEQSALRQVELETGEVVQDAETGQLYEISLRHLPVFAEGLALAEGQLFQLTWRQQTALRYNLDFFTENAPFEYATFSYEGEGWGLCYDGAALVMSNGSDRLALRDPQDFTLLEERPVTLDGAPLAELVWDGTQVLPLATFDEEQQHWRLELLNELECVDDLVYANVWLSDVILVIDGASGAVRSLIDAAGLLTEEERLDADVLNGIAWLPERETFLLTGKLWPKLFEVRFVAPLPDDEA